MCFGEVKAQIVIKFLVLCIYQSKFYMLEFRLPPRCRRDLRSSGILRSLEWQFLTDVAVQPIFPIFKGQ